MYENGQERKYFLKRAAETGRIALKRIKAGAELRDKTGKRIAKLRFNRGWQKGDLMLGVCIALLSGALMSIQGVFNTEVTKQTSLWVSSAFVQFTALLVCLIAWLFTDRKSVV